MPEYLSAIPSALLNESATLFRRKYYLNGSHAGFIMYMSDPAADQKDVDNIREALKIERAVQLPQPVYVQPERQERRHSDHPAVRSRSER